MFSPMTPISNLTKEQKKRLSNERDTFLSRNERRNHKDDETFPNSSVSKSPFLPFLSTPVRQVSTNPDFLRDCLYLRCPSSRTFLPSIRHPLSRAVNRRKKSARRAKWWSWRVKCKHREPRARSFRKKEKENDGNSWSLRHLASLAFSRFDRFETRERNTYFLRAWRHLSFARLLREVYIKKDYETIFEAVAKFVWQ